MHHYIFVFSATLLRFYFLVLVERVCHCDYNEMSGAALESLVSDNTFVYSFLHIGYHLIAFYLVGRTRHDTATFQMIQLGVRQALV